MGCRETQERAAVEKVKNILRGDNPKAVKKRKKCEGKKMTKVGQYGAMVPRTCQNKVSETRIVAQHTLHYCHGCAAEWDEFFNHALRADWDEAA